MIVRKWWIKCIAQRVLSHVPMGRRINQMWSYKARLLTLNQVALDRGILHIHMLRRAGFDLTDKVALEIGTGWKPIIPYVLRIAGCKKIILCDLYRNMNLKLFQATLRQVWDHAPVIADKLGLDISQVEKVLPQFTNQDFTTLLEESGFEYRAPFDVRKTDYPDGTIDIVTSRAVLEHIPPEDIEAMMKEMRRIIRWPTGVMVHTIDHSDHWEHCDSNISKINFLKFPRWLWAIVNSPITYQNRLRSCEHVQLMKHAGFEVKHIDTEVDGETLADTQRLRIHDDFKVFKTEELAVLVTHIVAVPYMVN